MMRDPRVRRLMPGVAGAVLVAIAAVPLAIGETGPSPSPIPQGCQLQSPQPEAPLKLNLVAIRRLAKTIVMEKEVFECFNAQGTLAQVKDVETFIEIVERAGQAKAKSDRSPPKRGDSRSQPSMTTIAKSASTATCVKDVTSGRVACRFDRLPLGTTSTPLARCSTKSGTYPFGPVPQPTHPVEMETIGLPGGLVKTVKVEKEVLDCAGAIGDVYVFTELLERSRGQSFGQTTATFHGVICLKNAATAVVTSCRLFTPAKAS